MNIYQLDAATRKIHHALDRTRHVVVEDQDGTTYELEAVAAGKQGRLVLRVKRHAKQSHILSIHQPAIIIPE